MSARNKSHNRRREVDRPLRRDVRWLGRLLGEVLIELEGGDLFLLEERIRKLAISRRRGPREERGDAAKALLETLADLPSEKAEPVIRAFSVYFRLVNLAEQHHRIRRARAHASLVHGAPQRGSVAAILMTAKKAGVPAGKAREAILSLEVTLTLTAHPSEATRRTVLQNLYRISHVLEHYDRCNLTAPEKEDSARQIKEEIATLWQTDEVRRERPTVGDEVKNVVWYIEEVLWDLFPQVSQKLARAFERAYGEKLDVTRVPIRLHSWVGGDMDGNPFVTPDVLDDAIRAYRARGLRRLLTAVRGLGATLSQSSRYAKPSAELLASLERDRTAMPDVAQGEQSRTEGEPWRRKLRFIEARLAASLAHVEDERERARRREPLSDPPAFAYGAPEALEADLALVADSQKQAHAAGAAEATALLERVRALGFQIAELEMRTPAADARSALAVVRGEGSPTDGSKRLLATLERVAVAQRRGGEIVCRTLILSMTESAEDLLAALACARHANVLNDATKAVTLDIVPLFETLKALQESPRILRALLLDPVYRAHLAQRGVQEIMVGYSDSGKEVGLLAASAALRQAQETLPAIAAEAGIKLRIFHGRGETVARGGGPSQQAILALPSGTVNGQYKATEQGEALDHKYGRPELALRNLELIIGGALLHTLDAHEKAPPEAEQRYIALFEELGNAGRRAYRSLVWENPDFPEFFFAATPLEEIAQLPIGSRPSKRAAGGLESLRAIPWVFAWTQMRAILPAWYGVGSAFEEVCDTDEKRRLLVEMAREWPFFRTVLDNVEMVVAKTDLGIASRYADLARPEIKKNIWPAIRAEHEKTKHWVKVLTGGRKLLDRNPTLQQSIRLRNPYVDPLNLIQVELVRRKRAGDPLATRPLLLTVNGIAAGMRNTG
ncbi:MAG TPA: phosphoenolpyruvate carboxylase [Polyangiaceae bacterium]|nr:phosphoenolpyruvate carboxylase [Polyangiaceae bacterium]